MMSIDSSQTTALEEGNNTRTSIGNHSQDDDFQPHGDSYGAPYTLPPGNDNDGTPFFGSHANINSPNAFSRLLAFDLLITLVVVGLIVVVITVYQHKGNLTRVQKHAFNTIITGLIVILGLSFFVRCRNECFSLGSDCSPVCHL